MLGPAPGRRLGVARALVDDVVTPGDVLVQDGVIADVGLTPGRAGTAVPGLLDLQVNGYAGVDLIDADVEAWQAARAALARDGVTSFVVNLVTAARERTRAALQLVGQVVLDDAPDGARLLGAALEGPYLSPERAGVHPPQYLRRPDVDELVDLASGRPVLGLTIAPDLPGAGAVIDWAAERSMLVSLGHSACTAEQAHAAFDRGARTVTHLFNAMAPLQARDGGLAAAALTRPDVTLQLICDGVHLSQDMVRLAFAAAPGRWVLVTDAMAAAGCGDGDFGLGEATVSVRGGVARDQQGTLAGSVTTLMGAVRTAVRCGADELDAIAAATTRPARLLGLRLPRLRPGDQADVVVLDDRLEVSSVLRHGREQG